MVCSQLHSASFLVTVRSDVLSDSDGQGRMKIRKASSLIFKENKCIWEKTINEKESSPMSICHHILSCSKELKRGRNIKNVYFFFFFPGKGLCEGKKIVRDTLNTSLNTE